MSVGPQRPDPNGLKYKLSQNPEVEFNEDLMKYMHLLEVGLRETSRALSQVKFDLRQMTDWLSSTQICLQGKDDEIRSVKRSMKILKDQIKKTYKYKHRGKL